jgi:hypothetical protein
MPVTVDEKLNAVVIAKNRDVLFLALRILEWVALKRSPVRPRSGHNRNPAFHPELVNARANGFDPRNPLEI